MWGKTLPGPCGVLPHSVILAQSGSKNKNQHESNIKQYGDFEFEL